MTAFASRAGGAQGFEWTWDLRSVNARGLDLRLRLPEGVAGLEQGVRQALSGRLARGSVTLSLKLSRNDLGETVASETPGLDRILTQLRHIAARAEAGGFALAPPTAAEIAALAAEAAPGGAAPGAELLAPLMADLEGLLDAAVEMREAEGRALGAVFAAQLGEIAALADRAAEAADARLDETRAALRSAMRRVVEAAPEIDEPRVAQELALIAVKQDVTEEIDRLRAHVAAARALLAEDAPAGRRLDFLAQEFNREANTLCSKSQSQPLTAVGLDLKAVIERLREQSQNVE